MRSLLRLVLTSSGADMQPPGYERFVSLANDEGLVIRALHFAGPPGAKVDMARLLAEIDRAQGFWIDDPYLLASDEVRRGVESRLADGAVAIAQLRWRSGPRLGEEFLQALGLEATSIRASCPGGASPAFTHPMLVVADRSAYEVGFRDPILFRGVNRLVLQQANGIGCFGEAQTILALPVAMIEPVDMRSDYFVNLPRPELPVMASGALPTWRGRVIALHGDAMHDEYVGPTGYRFPGVGVEDNEAFARNLLRAVAGGLPPSVSWEEAYRLVVQFETSLAHLINTVLSNCFGVNWFETAVSEKDRQNCAERWRGEGSRAPVQSYLDLIHYKKVLKEQWTLFAEALVHVRPRVERGTLLSVIQAVNDVRKMTMHATKQVYANRAVPTEEELSLLRSHCRLMITLERAAGQRQGASDRNRVN